MSQESKIFPLERRSHMLQKVRSFFQEKGLLEVDTPLLSQYAPIDEHIDVMSVDVGEQMRYLHTSPEYAMKRLLSMGMKDIYQLSHVYRLGEKGRYHNPEFTLLEWYRRNFDFEPFIEETFSLIELFVGDQSKEKISYRQVFHNYTGLDYLTASYESLRQRAEDVGLRPSSNEKWTSDDLLHLLMGSLVEPHLGKDKLTAVVNYPASQAALAQTFTRNNETVAKRFEIYFQGVELANGYEELTDASEQQRRLHESNQKREDAGKNRLPMDPHFLSALTKGLPHCCGVAVGFDRLMMLHLEKDSIDEVIPFGWDEI